MMSRAIFITATDTDAGKTWVSSSMLASLLSQGVDARAIKPIACGMNENGTNEDVAILLEQQAKLKESDIQFHTFKHPVAPALASQQEAVDLDMEALTAWVLQSTKHSAITLIEGVGGLMVPLHVSKNTEVLLSDWIQNLPDLEVMLVAPLRLGCMNQILLSAFALAKMGVQLKWIVLNDLNALGTAIETEAMVSPFVQKYFDEMPKFIHLKKNESMRNVL